MAVSPSVWHLQNAEHPLESIIRDHERLGTLLVQIPCGQHESPKLLQHLRKSLSHSSGLKPIVFRGLIAVIPTSDELPEKTLEVVGAFAVWEFFTA